MIHMEIKDPVNGSRFIINQTKILGKFFVWTQYLNNNGDSAVIAHSESSSERLCANACQRQWDTVLQENPTAYTTRSLTEYATAVRSKSGTFLIYNAGEVGFSVIGVPEKNALPFICGEGSWIQKVPHDMQETTNGMVPMDKQNACVVEGYDRALEICLEVVDDIPDFEPETEEPTLPESFDNETNAKGESNGS